VCDEISVCVEIARVQASVSTHVRHDCQVLAEEFLENPRAEVALQPGAVWGKNLIRLCVARETNDQVGGRVDEFTVTGDYRTRPSVVQDSFQDEVRGDLVIGLTYIEPKAIKCERLFVVLVG
jgi:hypothetical protein